MKKSKKINLSLNKKTISSLNLNSIKGGTFGTSGGCGTTLVPACPNQTTIDNSQDGNTICGSEGSHCLCK